MSLQIAFTIQLVLFHGQSYSLDVNVLINDTGSRKKNKRQHGTGGKKT